MKQEGNYISQREKKKTFKITNGLFIATKDN